MGEEFQDIKNNMDQHKDWGAEGLLEGDRYLMDMKWKELWNLPGWEKK